MNLDLLYHPLLEALGAALVHSLWQGALVAGALYLALRVFRSADMRYALCSGALALLFLLPVSTGVQIYIQHHTSTDFYTSFGEPTSVSESPAFEGASPAMEATTTSSASQHPVQDAYNATFTWRPFLVGIWFIGVILLSLRWIKGLVGVHRLKSKGLDVEEDALLSIFRSLRTRLKLTRSVRLLLTVHIDQPVVIGWFKPVVLLPLSIATNLPPEQVEAILAHELVHVRRQDYLVLMLQTVIEILFFYHPAVWWISHRMRIEREYCVDDLVTKVLDNDLTYVTALASLDSKRAGRLALGANDGSLVDRVRRIVERKVGGGPSSQFSWLGAGLLVLGCSLLITACVNWGQPDLDGTPEELYEAAIEKVRERNFTAAKQYAQQAAEQGDLCSMQLLIRMYNPRPERRIFKDGTSVENVQWGAEDEDIAMEWAKMFGNVVQEKAEAGESTAMVWLYLYQTDDWSFYRLSAGGLEKNDSLAGMWLERAFAENNPYAIRHMAIKAIRKEGDYEKGDRLFAKAAELGDEAAYYWWARTDTFPTVDRYSMIADLALTNKSPGVHHWLTEDVATFETQVERGNAETIPWKRMADSLRIKERLNEIPKDPTYWPHPFAEFQEMACHADESLFWED